MKLLITDAAGQYVPQQFAENFTGWGILPADFQVLMQGPEHQEYWDVWSDVLNYATIEHEGISYRLHQDGDLWALSDWDIIDDNGQIFDAKNDPFATPETIEYNCDKTEGFEDQFYKNEIVVMVEHFLDNIGDYIQYHSSKHNKPMEWALKNYDKLEFCLEHNSGYYCNNDNLGKWVKFRPSRLQEESGQGYPFDVIFIGTIGNLGEIEIPAENNKCHYLAGLTDDYFRIIARVA